MRANPPDGGTAPEAPAADPTREESLARLLGGGRAALEASLPPVAFLVAWIASGEDVAAAVGWSLAASAVLVVAALVRRRSPRAALVGMLAMAVAALLALWTGEARNVFLVQLLSNAASALAWTLSILVRWPLLGVIVGGVIGTRTRWRRDPVLVRAYGRASWIWVLQYAVRVVVFTALWWLDETTALAIMRVALTYPLVIACVAASGWVLFASIPKAHPGIRRPQPVPASEGAEAPQADR